MGLFVILLSTLGVNFQVYGQEDEATCEERYDIWKRVGTEEFYKIFSANADMRYCVSLYESGFYEEGDSKNIKDFLTFIDPAGKFKIQYPSDWNPTTPTDNIVKVMFEAPPNPTTFSEVIKVRYAPGNYEATLVDFVDEVLNNIRVYIPEFKKISTDDTTISGLPAKKVIFTGQYDIGAVQEMMVFVIQNSDGYILTYTNSPQSFGSKLPNAQKIIHTFELGDFAGEIPDIESLTESEETDQAITIPDWIRNNAEWWAQGAIGDNDFVSGIQYLIKEGIIQIPETARASTVEGSKEIPSWIKNNADWWAQGLISDDDFVKGIQYLVEKGIITV